MHVLTKARVTVASANARRPQMRALVTGSRDKHNTASDILREVLNMAADFEKKLDAPIANRSR